jgi:hypothetical protein
MSRGKRSSRKKFDLRELVRVIGYQLTAYIGRTNVWEVREWLKNSLPRHLEERMQATYDVAKPIEEVEFDLVAQYFLINKTDGIEPYKYPARMLRDAVDIPAARAVLMELVRKEFLINVADHLEDVKLRLEAFLTQANMPPCTAYKVGLNRDRLWLKLLHAGFPLEQQRQWDRGENWPLWDELTAAVPEMAVARVTPNIDTGNPYRYLRRAPK